MGFQLKTTRGYDFFEASSSMQKAIRRNDTKIAGYFALELWASGYANYVWKRLLTVSAEDCFGLITDEIWALYESYTFVNDKAKNPKGRIFISKAVILLCEVKKSRDADHLQNGVYDNKYLIEEGELERWIEEARTEDDYLPIPDYAFDVHTKKGKKMGKTKKEFFLEEQKALLPLQRGLFDDYPDTIE